MCTFMKLSSPKLENFAAVSPLPISNPAERGYESVHGVRVIGVHEIKKIHFTLGEGDCTRCVAKS